MEEHSPRRVVRAGREAQPGPSEVKNFLGLDHKQLHRLAKTLIDKAWKKHHADRLLPQADREEIEILFLEELINMQKDETPRTNEERMAYARIRADGTVLDKIRKSSPKSRRQLAWQKKIDSVKNTLGEQSIRISDEAIAEGLKMEIADYQKRLVYLEKHQPRAVNTGKTNTDLENTVDPSSEEDIHERIFLKEAAQFLYNALDEEGRFTRQEKTVAELTLAGFFQKEIAEKLGLEVSRISQIISAVIRKAKKKLNDDQPSNLS